MSTKTRTVAYIRVSTDKQADHGVSLDAQRAKIQAYAEVYELDIIAVEVDAGESAKTLRRPALQRALERLDRFEATALLVVKLDRLTRSVRDLCDLVDTYFKDGEHSLMSVSEQIDTRSAAGRMVLNMLTVIGQWEREAIGERTKAAMQHMKREGKFTGGTPPFGFRVVEQCLEHNDDEQRVINFVRELRAEDWSLRGIAEALTHNGYFARNGKPFQPMQIARMLTEEQGEEGDAR